MILTMKKNIILLAVLLLTAFIGRAQSVKSKISDNHTAIIKTWYESPHESNENTIVYRATKYVKDYTKDNPAYEFSELRFLNNTDFSVAYWRWCPKVNYTPDGKWTLNEKGDVITLDFGAGMCKCEAVILEKGTDFIKITLKEKE